MTHASVPHDEKLKAGITDDLVRYSVGIENVRDLINDLTQALERV
jgi:methionine-gamma-lyase